MPEPGSVGICRKIGEEAPGVFILCTITAMDTGRALHPSLTSFLFERAGLSEGWYGASHEEYHGCFKEGLVDGWRVGMLAHEVNKCEKSCMVLANIAAYYKRTFFLGIYQIHITLFGALKNIWK